MMQIRNVCEAAVKYFGEVPQKVKAIEELSELSAAIARDINDTHVTREEIIDEIADAYIMIQQLAIMYGEGHVIKRAFEKADRLSGMIGPGLKTPE